MRQALEMALEALETAESFDIDADDGYYRKAITTIKETLAQPEQEPVGYWMGKFSDGAATLYKVPQESFLGYTYQNIPLYAIPPQRKPLTDEEIQMCYETTGHCQTLRPQDKFAVFALARAIEAKLKEKKHEMP